MINPSEPRNEPVRGPLPPELERDGPGDESPDSARILLPRSNPELMTDPAGHTIASPNNETARIGILPDPPKPAPVQMKKTQVLSRLPDPIQPSAPLIITPTTARDLEPEWNEPVDRIPPALCWTLLIVSAAILIIQIWTYLS